MANFDKIKGRTVPFRSDSAFVKEMRDLSKFRYMKNLEKKQPTDAEMIRLLRKTNGFQLSKEELRTKRRKEDVF
ncbi:hypothetical protein CMI43_03200 [Candidatus Pacearchaeota archaeon]|jgi:hypothetical protein|nr:hypothetical protein [Candidatus Pacearchaeota archaeon]|tara:strand:- start:2733 stop:2954 length:222 start_codon:yes stop_codon:yes gene_type:complete